MATAVPSQVDVIIGGGGVGCSIAYHLSKRGIRDVALLVPVHRAHGGAPDALADEAVSLATLSGHLTVTFPTFWR